MSQVEFTDDGKYVNNLLYLPKFDKFLTLLSKHASSPSATLVQLKTLKLNKKLSDSELMMELKSAIYTKTIFKTEHEDAIPCVEVYDEYVFVILPENIFKYCIRTKELVKKQLHLLMEIVGVEKIDSGVIVTGVDVMQCGSVVLFDFEDLDIKSTHNLGASRPSCIKSFKEGKKNRNKFLIHHESYLTIFEIETTNLINALKTINTKTVSSSLDLNEKYNKIILTDQYRYVSVWDYDL